jgi:hypothetical protein
MLFFKRVFFKLRFVHRSTSPHKALQTGPSYYNFPRLMSVKQEETGKTCDNADATVTERLSSVALFEYFKPRLRLAMKSG